MQTFVFHAGVLHRPETASGAAKAPARRISHGAVLLAFTDRCAYMSSIIGSDIVHGAGG